MRPAFLFNEEVVYLPPFKPAPTCDTIFFGSISGYGVYVADDHNAIFRYNSSIRSTNGYELTLGRKKKYKLSYKYGRWFDGDKKEVQLRQTDTSGLVLTLMGRYISNRDGAIPLSARNFSECVRELEQQYGLAVCNDYYPRLEEALRKAEFFGVVPTLSPKHSNQILWGEVEGTVYLTVLGDLDKGFRIPQQLRMASILFKDKTVRAGYTERGKFVLFTSKEVCILHGIENSTLAGKFSEPFAVPFCYIALSKDGSTVKDCCGETVLRIEHPTDKIISEHTAPILKAMEYDGWICKKNKCVSEDGRLARQVSDGVELIKIINNKKDKKNDFV